MAKLPFDGPNAFAWTSLRSSGRDGTDAGACGGGGGHAGDGGSYCPVATPGRWTGTRTLSGRGPRVRRPDELLVQVGKVRVDGHRAPQPVGDDERLPAGLERREVPFRLELRPIGHVAHVQLLARLLDGERLDERVRPVDPVRPD